MRDLMPTPYFSRGFVLSLWLSSSLIKNSQYPANYFKSIHFGWGGSSLGKVLAASTWGPEYRSLAPMTEPGVVICICNPITGGGDMWILGTCLLSGLVQKASSRFSERLCLQHKQINRETAEQDIWTSTSGVHTCFHGIHMFMHAHRKSIHSKHAYWVLSMYLVLG